MKTTDEVIGQYKPMREYPMYFSSNDIENMMHDFASQRVVTDEEIDEMIDARFLSPENLDKKLAEIVRGARYNYYLGLRDMRDLIESKFKGE